MSNEGNLKPFTKENPPSHEFAKKNGSKGGKKRAENIRARKAYAEQLRDLLVLPMDSHQKPRPFDKSKSAGDVSNHGTTVEQETIRALVNRMLKGDVRAIELALKLMGEMPADKAEVKVEAAEPEKMTLEELARKLQADE